MSGVDNLKLCPFCGGKFIDISYDRRIVYSCPTCGYERCFPGLLQLRKGPAEKKYAKIPYAVDDKTDKDGFLLDPEFQQYYHYDAPELAVKEMNERDGFIIELEKVSQAVYAELHAYQDPIYKEIMNKVLDIIEKHKGEEK